MLKWPNDLVLGNAKLGGILVESKTQGEKVSFAILGIGLNVNQGKAQLPLEQSPCDSSPENNMNFEPS